MPHALTIAEAQADLDQAVDAAQTEPIMLTRGGAIVAVLTAPDEPNRTGLSAYIQRFRETHDLEALNAAEAFDGLREGGPGREVLL